MSAIRRLPETLSNKIAAGEVVERPASVVRELIENSIDAMATGISVEVNHAGRALIRVSDNGAGMDAGDAELSLERHATSKLPDEDALFHITTMGFRGEALPSIASVSRLTLRTAPRGVAEGVSIEVEGGALKSRRAAPSVGTTVEVRDLFYNTPARRKFLKRDSTELLHVVDTVTDLAISHPSISFTLTADGQETFRAPRSSGCRERLAQIYGEEFVSALSHVARTTGHLSVDVYFSAPGSLRDTRANQHIFINGRPVRDTSLSHAIYSAYDGIEPRGKHPVYFAFVAMDPGTVDFNVHPAKREVRFADKEAVYRFLRRAISESLRAGSPLPMPEDSARKQTAWMPSGMASSPTIAEPAAAYESYSPSQSAHKSEPLLDERRDLPFVYIGDTFVAYASEGGGLSVVDHHAAHERVLYERMLSGLKLDSKMLLFPRQIKLSAREYMIVLENSKMLIEFGIEIDDFGKDTVVVRSLPAEMDEADLRGILADAAAAMGEGERPGRTLRESVAARIACHASIRGSRVLTRESFAALIDALSRCEDPMHCPHGRPTVLTWDTEELKKLFKRT